MKTILLSVLLSFLTVSVNAQGKMKVVLTDGTTTTYDVNEIKEVLFEDNAKKFFEEPYSNWGASRDDVKSAMQSRGYTLMQESNNASDDYFVAYSGKCQEQYSVYYFDESKLFTQVDYMFLASKASIEDLCDFLSSEMAYKYVGLDKDRGYYYYLTKDGKSYAVVRSGKLSNGTEVTHVTYIQYSASSARERISSHDSEDRIRLIDKLEF